MNNNESSVQTKRVENASSCCRKHSQHTKGQSVKTKSNYWILFFLIVLFAAPGMIAYGVYQYPSFIQAPKVNKGTLLTPPVVLNDFPGQGQWRTVYWSAEACEASCIKTLDTLARMRLALGRHLYNVDLWLFLDEHTKPLSAQAKESVQKLGFQIFHLQDKEQTDLKELFKNAEVFVVDPDNYFILSYAKAVNPNDVYKDLKLLLNTANNQKGSLNAK